MKKIIALILTLVLILSMSIYVSAVEAPASLYYYVHFNCPVPLDNLLLTIYYQPAECNDDVIPDPLDDEFVYYAMSHWEYIPLTELKEDLFCVPIITLIDTENTGNFIVHAQYEYEGSTSVYVSDLLNFFNGKNAVEINFGEESATCEYVTDRLGYVNNEKLDEHFFVYGSRGEQMTTGEVVSVDLEWGGMEFVYTPEQTVWNPNTHEYEPVLNADGSSAAGWTVAEGSSNHIKITNHSNASIEAALTFTSAEGKGINGTFGNSILYCDSAEATYNSPEKAPTDSTEFNIIRCEIDAETAGNLGTITITIRHWQA